MIAMRVGGDNATQGGKFDTEPGGGHGDIVTETREPRVDHHRPTVAAVVDEVTVEDPARQPRHPDVLESFNDQPHTAERLHPGHTRSPIRHRRVGSLPGRGSSCRPGVDGDASSGPVAIGPRVDTGRKWAE